MPRPAAIIMGLVLVASSIGFNMVRYPMVWEMVGPVQASESAQPAAVQEQEQHENQPSAEPFKPSPLPARPIEPIEVKPTPEVGDQVIADDGISLTDLEPRKPLVPVMPIGLSSMGGSAAMGGEGIRRLPPVDASVAAPNHGQFADGTIPIYPTTGIE